MPMQKTVVKTRHVLDQCSFHNSVISVVARQELSMAVDCV